MSRRLRYSLLKHGRVACERCKACYNDLTKDGAILSTKWTFVRVACDSFSGKCGSVPFFPKSGRCWRKVSLAPRNWRRVLHDMFLE